MTLGTGWSQREHPKTVLCGFAGRGENTKSPQICIFDPGQSNHTCDVSGFVKVPPNRHNFGGPISSWRPLRNDPTRFWRADFGQFLHIMPKSCIYAERDSRGLAQRRQLVCRTGHNVTTLPGGSAVNHMGDMRLQESTSWQPRFDSSTTSGLGWYPDLRIRGDGDQATGSETGSVNPPDLSSGGVWGGSGFQALGSEGGEEHP